MGVVASNTNQTDLTVFTPIPTFPLQGEGARRRFALNLNGDGG
jgi:hypothetical protein